MMRILNTNILTPGGFPYVQPETGMKFPGMVSWSQQKHDILSHRLGNNLPRATEEEVEIDLHTFQCQRLGNDPTYCADGIVVVNAQKKTPSTAGAVAGVGLFAQAKLAAGAVAMAAEWLGDGANPVTQEHAQARGDICTGRLTGNKCPKNETSGWSWPMAAAQRFHKWLEQKQKMNLKVEGESMLGTCAACTCNLPLKVWVPFHHIYKHTSDDTFQRLDPRCWMLKERNQAAEII